ncbi:MAG: hypothetical protein XD73_0238 [Anaerolinea thermophila]|uniref:Uncharacterized protein n=1 Tax=Anaerolinea thermophila TaxID=167964 RepID=A0A117LH60_9CHLR|nr:MAG: hypothetical protein XD73_0238 [Anaerolinea thermophila]
MDLINMITKSDYQFYLEASLHLGANIHGQIQKQPTEFLLNSRSIS